MPAGPAPMTATLRDVRSLFFVPDSGDVDVAPALPLPGGPVDPVRGDGDDGGAPRNSLWRKGGPPPGRGQHRGFEPRHVGEVPAGHVARPPPGSRSGRHGAPHRPRPLLSDRGATR